MILFLPRSHDLSDFFGTGIVQFIQGRNIYEHIVLLATYECALIKKTGKTLMGVTALFTLIIIDSWVEISFIGSREKTIVCFSTK
jgi:hypothetical protein